MIYNIGEFIVHLILFLRVLMRIIVLSDWHGDVFSLSCALEAHPTATVAVFLGDGSRDLEAVASLCENKRLIAVRGNCDFACDLPYNQTVELAGKRIYCTHGHLENVKMGNYKLRKVASWKKADLALYGHTHKAYVGYKNGLYLFNPGSAAEGSYGIVDITRAGIVCKSMQIKYK